MEQLGGGYEYSVVSTPLEFIFGCRSAPSETEVERRVSSIVDLLMNGVSGNFAVDNTYHAVAGITLPEPKAPTLLDSYAHTS